MSSSRQLTTLFLCVIIIISLTVLVIPANATVGNEGIELSTDSHHISIGGTTNIVATTTPSNLYVNWISSNTSVATVNSSGIVTGLAEGKTTISAYCYNPATSSAHIDSIEITVHGNPIGLEHGETYYISNFYYGKFLSTAVFAEYANMIIVGMNKNSLSFSQWELDYQTDGTIQIINNFSPSNQCMTVNGTQICSTYDNEAPNQKFIIERITTGLYYGYYFIRYQDKYVAIDSANNIVLMTIPAIEAYWSFSPVEKGFADLYSQNFPGTNTSVNNTSFVSTFNNAEYSAFAYTSATASAAYERMNNYDDVFVIIAHAAPGMMALYSTSAQYLGSICSSSAVQELYQCNPSSNILDLPDNALSNLRVVLYIGCQTGVDVSIDNTTYNLVDDTFNKGAHFVLGTTEDVYISDANVFLHYFISHINAGHTVGDSVQKGITEVGTNSFYTHNSFPIYKIGDEKQYLD